MDVLKDRRTVFALAGAGVALMAGLAMAWFLISQHRGETPGPPPASKAGLVIDTGEGRDARLDAAKPLRCFVAGQLVGELTLGDCAKRNGVATDALDVGLDRTGALAAADQAGALITPLPPTEAANDDETPGADAANSPAAPQVSSSVTSPCWRYAEGQWRKLLGEQTLNACVQIVFAGRCERAAEAAYGRWAQQTLRLEGARVEISTDNRNFRALLELPSCSAAPTG